MTQRILQLAAVVLFLAYGTAAVAQWAWRDDAGSLVFSDQPPPAGVKPNQIVRQPGAVRSTRPIYATDEKPAAAKGEARRTDPAANGPKTAAERELDFRKRARERGEAEKKAGEEQTRKQQLAQDCERSRGYLRGLEDGRRIARTDVQGNQIVLDDAARAEEISRLRSRIASDCN